MTGQVDGECENNNEPATKKARTARSKQTRVDKEARLVAQALGRIVADMHNVNIVHGDLTTSNIMMMPPSPPQKQETEKEEDTNKWKPKLVLIDFGLSSTAGSKGVSHEEKAVDLYVLERAFESTHPGSSDLVAEFHRSYKGHSKTSDSVLQRLSQVRMRGRKRDCFG
jgi:TP53 regulating kinase-like protein